MPRLGRTLQILLVLTAAVALAFAGYSPAPQETWAATPSERWLDTNDREAVLTAFQAEFTTVVPSLGWDGDQGDCDPGANAVSYRSATLRRVNFYRAMAGVPGDVVDDPIYSMMAQRAAMMMSAEGELTHEPGTGFACFSEVGREAAANSNLYLGRNGPSAVDGYVEDPGDRNIDVGHRTTILHPPTARMGVGDVGSSASGSAANALWVFDDQVFDEDSPSLRPDVREPERFIAWPPRGHVPRLLVHPRWSFTLAGADFASAEVSVFRMATGRPPAPVPISIVYRSGGVGHVPLPTIVWEPDLESVNIERSDGVAETADASYLVVVENVEAAGGLRSFGYEVRVLGSEPSGELTIEEFVARLGS